MGDKSRGFVLVYRCLQESAIWNIDEPYDSRSAWIDLILTATHKDYQIMDGREVKILKAGQLKTSLLNLSEKWKWSKNKVNRYLKMLENAGMISKKGNANGTTITIENWGKYQIERNAYEDVNGTLTEHERNANGTETDYKQQHNNINNIKQQKQSNSPGGRWGKEPE